MEYLFLLIIAFVIGYLIYKANMGSLLCLLTLFPEIIGIILHKAGIMGFNMVVKYLLLIIIIWSCRSIINVKYYNLWKNPLSVLFHILIGTVVLHNYYIIGGAYNNPEIAAFQLNIIIRIYIPYTVIMLVGDNRKIINDYCRSIPWWGLFFFIIFVFLIGIDLVDFSNRMTLQKETGINSIPLSRYAAMTLLSSLFFLIHSHKRIKKYLYTGIFVFAMFMLLLASQRGTVIGVVIAILIGLGIIMIRQHRLKQFVGVSIGVIGVTYFLLTYFDFEIINRFQDLENYKKFERFSDYGIAWRAFCENGYLTGLGSMGYHTYTHDLRPYPHSLILELMSEYGIVGLIYALSVIIGGGIMAYNVLAKKEYTHYMMVVPLIWIALLSSVLVSGSFVTNAPFFLITAVLILVYQ